MKKNKEERAKDFYQLMHNYAHSFSPPLQIWWPNGIQPTKWPVPKRK